MNYRYQRSQLFAKRLPVPSNIERKVFNCTLSLREYFEYELEDKVPISCIHSMGRPIIERFGIEKCRDLDFDLLNKCCYYIHDFNILSFLLNLNPEQESINDALYEFVKDKMRPSDYSKRMKEKYPERIILEENDNPVIQYLIMDFNEGRISLSSILAHWELFENKDLTYVLQHERYLKKPITDSELKEFMKKHSRFAKLLVEHSEPYEFFENYPFGKEEEENEYIKSYTDHYLDSLSEDRYGLVSFTNEEFETIFQYSSLKEHLDNVNSYYASFILKELESLPENYIFHTQIPFEVFLQYGVLTFIGRYGLKNVVDFDNECGHFFTNNNCYMLSNMFYIYLHYDGNNHDPDTNFWTKRQREDETEEDFFKRGFTKDEFYEAIRRMLLYGPTDFNYRDSVPSYQDVTGEFRVRNQELFISEDAPKELQKLFYTRSVTPELLAEHPEYKSYLIGKKLEACFPPREVHISDEEEYYKSYDSIYHYLTTIADYDSVLDAIVDYRELFNVVYDRTKADYTILDVSHSFSLEDFKNTVDNQVYEYMVQRKVGFPKEIPSHFIEHYPNLFLEADAPEELKDAYYSRQIDGNWIHSHPEYIEYLRGLDLEILYPYMPMYNKNIIRVAKEFFQEDAFDFLLTYAPYIQIAHDNHYLEQCNSMSIETKEMFVEELDKIVYRLISEGKTKYDEGLSDSFKEKNPTLFLRGDYSQEFRNKFYNREFQLSDLEENPNLLVDFL